MTENWPNFASRPPGNWRIVLIVTVIAIVALLAWHFIGR